MEFNFENYLKVVERISEDYFDNIYGSDDATDIIARYGAYSIADWDKDVEFYNEGR